jgi:hypothetical protein
MLPQLISTLLQSYACVSGSLYKSYGTNHCIYYELAKLAYILISSRLVIKTFLLHYGDPYIFNNVEHVKQFY